MPLAPIFPTPPAPHDPNPRLEVLLEGNLVTDRFGVQWQGVLSNLGNGEFHVLNDNECLATLDNDQLVLFRLDESEFCAWIVQRIHHTVVGDGDEASEITIVSGETTLTELSRAVVFPGGNGIRYVDTPIFVGYLGTKPYSSDRYWGPMERTYDHSGWDAATEVTLGFPPENWPDRSAWWLGDTSDVLHFYDEFTTSGAFTAKAFFAAANSVLLFVDNVLVARVDEEVDGDAASKTREVKFQVTDGDHTIYARVARGTKPDSLFRYSVINTATGAVFTRSTSSTLMTDTVEGVTAGYVSIRAFTEAQDRGRLPLWDWDYDAELDSDGRPWPRIGDWYVSPVKDTLLQLHQQLVEGWAEMDAPAALGGRTLQMWVAEGVSDAVFATGVGRTVDMDGLAIEAGVNATQIVYERTS